jgi:hypothetical protein
MKKIVLGFSIAVVSIIAVGAINGSVTDLEITDPTEKESLVSDYNVYSIAMPEKLNFAGEKVPLTDPDIQERFDNELLSNVYFQSNAIKLIKKAQKYFPIIESILKEEGIPDDFKYLVVAESALSNAVSPAGAKGFWQMMPATARELGMEVNDNVDERYDLEMSTRAACNYLKDSKKNFGTWTLAAAAYNAGNAGVNRQQDRQETEVYYDLLLNNETARYVFRILALKEILEKPVAYGFNVSPEHYYKNVPVTKVKVDYAVDDLVAFAKEKNISYKVLKIHNPWLREANLNNESGKTYYFSIPEAGYYH